MKNETSKYEREIDDLLEDLCRKDWMTDEEYKQIVDGFFKLAGVTKQSLSDDLEVGVKNGYTIEQQTNFLKRVWSSLKTK